MPKTIKKKAVKQKPVQDSAVKSPALLKIEKLKERQKQLITAAVIVVVLIALYSIYAVYSSSLTGKARALNNRAADYYYSQENDESLPADERLRKSVELYSKSMEIKPTPEALFYLGNAYYRLGDYENAIKQYSTFTDRFSENEELLPLVYQKLASACFKSNKNDRAGEVLTELSRIKDGIFRDTALVIEARHLESTGQKEKAFEKYRQILEEFPSSAWASEAGSRVSAAESVKSEDTNAKPDEKTGTQESPGNNMSGEESDSE